MHLTVTNSFDSKTKQEIFENANFLSDMEKIPALQHDVFDGEDKIMGLRTECRRLDDKIKIQVFHNYSEVIASSAIPCNYDPQQLLKTLHALILKKTAGFTWSNRNDIVEELHNTENIADMNSTVRFHYNSYLLGRKRTSYSFKVSRKCAGFALLLYKEGKFCDFFPVSPDVNPSSLPARMEEILWEQISQK